MAEPPPRRSLTTNPRNGAPAKRPLSMFNNSPLRASVTPASNDDLIKDSTKRRMSGQHQPHHQTSFFTQLKKSTSTNPSRESTTNNTSGGVLSIPETGNSVAASRNSSVKSHVAGSKVSFATTHLSDGSNKSMELVVPQQQPQQQTTSSKRSNRIHRLNGESDLLHHSGKHEPTSLNAFKLISESKELMGSDAALDVADRKASVSYKNVMSTCFVKPVLYIANPDPDEDLRNDESCLFVNGLRIQSGSVKQLLHLNPPPKELGSESLSMTSENEIVASLPRDSELCGSMASGFESTAAEEYGGSGGGGGGGGGGRRSVTEGRRLSVVSGFSKKTSNSESNYKRNSVVFRRDSDSDKDFDDGASIKPSMMAASTRLTTTNKAVLKAIDTIKANSTKKGLGWGEIMLINGFIQAIVLGCLESYVLWSVWKFVELSWGSTSGSAQFYLAWNKNSMQVIACILFNLGILAYSFIQINHIKKIKACAVNFVAVYASGPYPSVINQFTLVSEDGTKSFNLQGTCPWSLDPDIESRLISSLGGLGNLFGVFFGYKTYQEYGWSMYQVQGASIERKWIMTRYHMFILVLKLNYFLHVGFRQSNGSRLLLLPKGNHGPKHYAQHPWILGPTSEPTVIFPNDYSKVPRNLLLPLSIVAISAGVLSYLFGWNAIRKCNRYLMLGFLGLLLADFVAVIYGLSAVFTDPKYEITKDALALFCSINLIINIITWFIGLNNIRDFDRGLKELRGISNCKYRRRWKQDAPEDITGLIQPDAMINVFVG
ncbi:hypothetical protein BDR26DRAFT_1009479 [Obelidium mucronatum]|nr:hypothetical protein BDR26DRAFT_1009479 [Obelidium mucronatum]